MWERCIATVLLCALVCVPSYAHSGRTDSRGGHTDHSTGEYHYHHGKPAHQHINGTCPYDAEKDNSNQPTASDVAKPPTSKKGMPIGGSLIEWIVLIVFGGPAVIFVLSFVLFHARWFLSWLFNAIRKLFKNLIKR